MEPQQTEQQPKPDQEESIFYEADYSMKGYDKHIKNARILLFIIAGIQFLPLVFAGPIPEEDWWFIIGEIIFKAVVYAGLALLTYKKPYTALVIAVCFYVGWILLMAVVVDWTYLIRGWLINLIAIVLLITGIRNAKEAQDLKKTFNQE